MSINNGNEDATTPCQNSGCTFWGRPATEGLCSKCYNAKQKDQPSNSSTLSVTNNSSPASSTSSVVVNDTTSLPLASISAGSTETSPKRKIQEHRNRCFQCNKKTGLTGIECRCGYVYCGAHRYPDTHSCDFDFKKHDRELLAKANEKVVGTKVDKI